MPRFRYKDEHEPPPAKRASDVAITRFEHVYEVDPRLMSEFVTQQPFSNWDTERIVHSRHAHLQWMHTHWAARVISGEEILAGLEE